MADENALLKMMEELATVLNETSEFYESQRRYIDAAFNIPYTCIEKEMKSAVKPVMINKSAEGVLCRFAKVRILQAEIAAIKVLNNSITDLEKVLKGEMGVYEFGSEEFPDDE